MRALTSEYYQSHGTQGEKITDGIDITTLNVKRNDENIVFSVWDFAGQTVYYNTHQVTVIFLICIYDSSVLLLLFILP